MSSKSFDLNMEDVLEFWEPSDAIREVIANSLDEYSLSGSKEPEIYKQDGKWYIRDYGRGLQYQNLTQAEDDEKLEHPDKVIGKFGVGLKDALATFHRNGIDVKINSQHNTFKVKKSPKSGFDDIETLHAKVIDPEKPNLEGTEVILENASDSAIKEAKNNFIYYTNHTLVESTKFGEIYKTDTDTSEIFVNGLKVAEEDNFLFSYNITNTTKNIRDSLNRERSNVGRTAYSSRVKKILKGCESGDVADLLCQELEKFNSGEACDEISWKTVRVHAVKLMNSKSDVVFVTSEEKEHHRDLVDDARQQGKNVVTIPENVSDSVHNEEDVEGNSIKSIDLYAEEYNESFEFSFVEYEDLDEEEQNVWDTKDKLFEVIDKPSDYDIKVSTELRATDESTAAVCVNEDQLIVIKREVLSDIKPFLGFLLHELAHTETPFPDQTREFEMVLTEYLGILGSEIASDEEEN